MRAFDVTPALKRKWGGFSSKSGKGARLARR
jgi:hypothetical protein